MMMTIIDDVDGARTSHDDGDVKMMVMIIIDDVDDDGDGYD